MKFIVYFSFLFAACSTIPKNATPARTVSGTITHKENEPHAFQGPFRFASDSYAFIQFQYCDNAADDIDCKVIANQKITDLKKFPVEFKLKVEGPENCNDDLKICLLDVDIHQHAGDQALVGDAKLEWRTEGAVCVPRD